jgi:hypothetical protein
MGVHENLSVVQKSLKAPKSQYNSFGKYNYRNCEDILEAVKPLLIDSSLYIYDEIIQIGDRYYVKATVVFRSGPDEIKATAYAREEQDKKGMDSSQITGAASSYARKYALNGLFLIDDTKDSDATNDGKNKKKDEEHSEQPPVQPAQPPASPQGSSNTTTISDAQAKRFFAIAKGSGKSDEVIKAYIIDLKLEHTKDMPKSIYEEACKWAAEKIAN